MRRMVCVWLPRFRTDRLERAEAVKSALRDRPLAVTASGNGGNRLIAVNSRAEASGLRPDMLLTDATAVEPGLKAVDQDIAGEKSDLKNIAEWCRRYAPWTGQDAPDGLWLDITGAAHLFGGERDLLMDLQDRFERAGFKIRAAIASTHAAAWGLARHAERALTIIPDGEEKRALAPLPVRALHIAKIHEALFNEMGFKTIGQLYEMPRDALRARFSDAVVTRLDQALGRTGEALSALAYNPVYVSRMDFNEPVKALEAIKDAATLLSRHLSAQLNDHGKAARSYMLTLFDTEGGSTDVTVSLARASNTQDHIIRLLHQRLGVMEGRFHEALGFDGATLRASRIEVLTGQQPDLLESPESSGDKQALDQLFDRLTARLGWNAVRRFVFRQSHIPERATISRQVLDGGDDEHGQAETVRPFLLLPRPEPITAIAELPDYPPRRFTWRRKSYTVAKAEGPERITAEWWRSGEGRTPPRDYYIIEDEAGHRFWIYREGLYSSENEMPRWFLHGLFP